MLLPEFSNKELQGQIGLLIVTAAIAFVIIAARFMILMISNCEWIAVVRVKVVVGACIDFNLWRRGRMHDRIFLFKSLRSTTNIGGSLIKLFRSFGRSACFIFRSILSGLYWMATITSWIRICTVHAVNFGPCLLTTAGIRTLGSHFLLNRRWESLISGPHICSDSRLRSHSFIILSRRINTSSKEVWRS